MFSMKTLVRFVLVLFILLNYKSALANGNLYVFESAAKVTGYMRIGFVEIIDSQADVALYTLKYSNGKIFSVKGPKKRHLHPYSISSDGNVYIEGLGLIGYSYENYISKEKFYHDELYNMISPNFVTISNYKKLEAIKTLLKGTP
jgi:hypothetical protein